MFFSSEVAGPLPCQLGITLATFVLLALVIKTYGVDLSAASRDARIVPFGLFVALPLVLWGCMTLGDNDYLADRRYYWPLVPLSVFVFYSLASLTDVPKRSGLTRMLQTFGVVYLTGYIAVSLAYIVFFFVPGERGANQRAKLMANELRHWPSMAVTYELFCSRREGSLWGF
jgi:cbb3-type cytochrome oxidase subunit 3